jgi:hypothetical protein
MLILRPDEFEEVLPAGSVCLAFIMWLPSLSVAAVKVTVLLLQVPGEPVAVVFPSKSWTDVPFSQETVNEGVLLLVVSSVFDDPVSEPAVMSGEPGAVGVDVSIVIERVEESVEAFPATSDWWAFTRNVPSLIAEGVMETVEEEHVPVPSVVDPESTVTVSPVSQETVKVGVLSLVMSSVLEEPVSDPEVKSGVPVAAGADVSMVIESPVEATDVLPAGSVCLAVIEWLPSLWAAAVNVTVLLLQVPLEPEETVSL